MTKQHSRNVLQNTLYTNDNMFILHGLNSELVDLIYLDPPFNSKLVDPLRVDWRTFALHHTAARGNDASMGR